MVPQYTSKKCQEQSPGPSMAVRYREAKPVPLSPNTSKDMSKKKHPVRLKTPGPCPRGVTAWHMKRGLEKMEVKGQVSSELTSSQILAPLHQEPGLLQTTAQRCKRMRRPQREVPGHHLPALSAALFVPVCLPLVPSTVCLVCHLLCLPLSFLEEEAAH